MLLWAIGEVFTMILIHGLAMLSIGYGCSLFHSIGIPTFAKLIAPNKIIKKTCVYFGVICVHYMIVLICDYMLT